jgi:hypothetical protein
MSPWRTELRATWERYLRDGQAEPLARFLASHPEAVRACGHTYPLLHRIRDVVAGDAAYRVLRCAACDEDLTIQPIAAELARPDDDGVPYRLTGPRLRQWVVEETEHESDGPVDWRNYE